MSEDGKTVELDADGAGIEIEIIDDTPEQDRGRPARVEGKEPYDVKDEEIATYKESVQDRIKKLRFEFHEERRAKEQALRENGEAVRIAQHAISENRRLQELAMRHERIAMEAAKARTDAEIDRAKRLAREAYEAGDTEQAIAHQADLARFAVERDRIAQYVPPQMPQQPPQQQQYVQQPQRQVQQAPEPQDPKAVDWAKRNAWFGDNEEMTGAAYGVHERLMKEGIDPRSDDYYQRLDAVMRRRFPESFDEEEVATPRRASPVVASATRSVKTPRKVQLTATQVALARKLGLTTEQYASELLKANPNG